MPSDTDTKSLLRVLVRALILATLVAVALISGKFNDLINLYDLGFVLTGGVAMALMSFAPAEIGTAFKKAGATPEPSDGHPAAVVFWESASRSFWMVGVLASVITFAIALTSSEGGIAAIATRMASSFIGAVYGLILSVICLVPAFKLSGARTLGPSGSTSAESGSAPTAPRPAFRYPRLVGYTVFVFMVAGTLIEAHLRIPEPNRFQAWEWLIYWPAVLVVLGGTSALVLFIGNAGKGQSFTFGFAVTGLLGALLGFIQVLLGMAARNIQDVSAAVSFVLSSCFFALLGMILVGAPLGNRWLRHSPHTKPPTLSLIAGYVFPLVALIFLVITWVVVLTPMKQ